MFRYEAGSFLAALESINVAHRELRMYEEQIRCLSSKWESDPDVPAPRAKLKRTISNMEEWEASLLILCRRLESISKHYEETEQRNTDLAEETVAEAGVKKRNNEENDVPAGQEDLDTEQSGTAFSELIYSMESYVINIGPPLGPNGKLPSIQDIVREIARKMFWQLKPIYNPWIRRLLPPYRPVRPWRPRRLWPPRHPGGYLPFPDRRPDIWIKEWSGGKLRLLVASALPVHSIERQQRQQRIRKLFGGR